MSKDASNGVIKQAPLTRSRSRQLQTSTDTSPKQPAVSDASNIGNGKKSRKRKVNNKMEVDPTTIHAAGSVSSLLKESVAGSIQNGSLIQLNSPPSNGKNKSHSGAIDDTNSDEDRERARLTLWNSPIRTLRYFLMECLCLLQEYGARCARMSFFLPLGLVTLFLVLTYNVDGAHQSYVGYLEKKLLICLYWIGLGILSSIGLGTGLHTFILYLGPHIAAVTLAAYECGTLNFPEPPYPDEILCPDGLPNLNFHVTLWSIISKVRLESFMWGLGTAIGELPPYFMARAARLSGRESEELLEVQALLEDREEHHRRLTLMQRGKIFMEQLVAKVGFFGILLGASIPNPLFDLAGITCGHFLVPFGTFFGATLLGKAVIKMHIQMIFVIITFSERHVEHLISLFTRIPRVGPYMERPFVEFLDKQKRNLHRKAGDSGVHHGDASWLQFIFEKIVICMVIYFVLSIIHSLAQNYHRRTHRNSQRITKGK